MKKAEEIDPQWQADEWKAMRRRLDKLSLNELRIVATSAGVMFEDGNESIIDRPHLTAKEQFILVLDEVPKAKLLAAYHRILARRASDKK